MAKANDGSPPEWLSTHPSNKSRLTEIKKTLSAVEPLFNESIDHKK
jgi:predicted Zn-dependent protease